MKVDTVIALLASLRMAEEAALAAGEARIAQIDAVMRGLSLEKAGERCPVCGSEQLANADTQAGRARVCAVCGHSFALDPLPEDPQ